jgi:DNA helicase-2/ATP-dependent DNA helicase PcrA
VLATTTPAPLNYAKILGISWTPSVYQERLWDWIVNGRGHRVVKAVAGSGKTTSIASGARLITGTGLFCSFNVPIALELAKKLKGTSMKSSTVNAHGNRCVCRALGRRVPIVTDKYKKMVDAARDAIVGGSLRGEPITPAQRVAVDKEGFPAHTTKKLIDLARLDLLDLELPTFPTLLLELAARHGLDDYDECLDELVIAVVHRCMELGRGEKDSDIQEIDYIDQLWLPCINGWQPQQYSWIVVDETQDLSAVQLELLSKSRRKGGRMLFVGDPKQAINGFAGADAESFNKIVARTGADPLELSVCYRCPTAVLDLARAYCPEIEARPGAPVGIVRTLPCAEYVADAKEGDLVLCRRNAPLLSMCFELIGDGVPAQVQGKDIGAKLTTIIRKAARGRDFADFGLGLEAWRDHQVEAATIRIKDADRLAERVELIDDQEACVRVVWASSKATSAAEMCGAVEQLFADGRGSVTLSSIHKAKGLEAKRVAILRPELLARPDDQPGDGGRPQQPWQLEQEKNLAYVAITRAMEELIWLS